MRLQVVEHVVQAHLAQAVQQGAGVFQHHARLLALVHQLRDELAHALVAPVEDRGVVVVADARVVHHVLEVADDLGGAQVAAAGRDQRLVHVQGDGERALDAAEVNPALRQEDLLLRRRRGSPCRARLRGRRWWADRRQFREWRWSWANESLLQRSNAWTKGRSCYCV